MPTYNDSSTIAYSLDSILSQNYKNYEIIIVDDGSTDDTKKVINNYKKKTLKLLWFRSQFNYNISGWFIFFLFLLNQLPMRKMITSSYYAIYAVP